MITTLRATFDGKVLVPEGAVNLPVGRPLTLRMDPADQPPSDLSGKTGLQRLADLLEQHGPVDLPADYSAQHDHYLYGTPKRDNP